MSAIKTRLEQLERALAESGSAVRYEIVWDDEVPPGSPLRWVDDDGRLHIRMVWDYNELEQGELNIGDEHDSDVE